MAIVRTILFYLAMIIWLLVAGIIGLPSLLLPRRWTVHCVRFWLGGCRLILRVIGGIRFEVRGQEHRPDGAAIIASQHQSIFETIFSWTYLPLPALVMKRSIVFIPVAGWYALKMGCIPVDRGGRSRALRQMTRDCADAAQRGHQIIVYPEGTRSPAGTLSALKTGVAGLYKDLGLPCVPITLNSGTAWPADQFALRPGVITLEFLEPIPPGLPRKDFMDVLENRLSDGFTALQSRL